MFFRFDQPEQFAAAPLNRDAIPTAPTGPEQPTDHLDDEEDWADSESQDQGVPCGNAEAAA